MFIAVLLLHSTNIAGYEFIHSTYATIQRRKQAVMTRTLATVALTLVVLSGCTAPPPEPTGDYADYTLAETKSPVQLLRNHVADTVPRSLVEAASASLDLSVACFPQANDPDGTIRSWTSTVDLSIAGGTVGGIDVVFDNLVADLSDEGWSAEDAELAGADRAVLLTRDASIAEIEISKPEGESVLQIKSTGPCVKTDGAESDEVRELEAR